MAIEGGTGKKHRTVKLVQLVGGLEHFLFFHILGIILPTDELIFFRGVGIPPTRQWCSEYSQHVAVLFKRYLSTLWWYPGVNI
jgi:hypothetical protein